MLSSQTTFFMKHHDEKSGKVIGTRHNRRHMFDSSWGVDFGADVE